MKEKDREILKYLLARYKHNWDRNKYYRDNYDEDLECYLGARRLDTPLSYNESFNKVLPIIYTILSRFMGQIYQTGDIVSVKPRKRANLVGAKKVQDLLNFQLESLNDLDSTGGSYLTNMKWFFNALTFGKGIIKCYWRKEDRITPERLAIPIPNFDRLGNFQGMDMGDFVTQTMKTVYDGPYCEVLHNKTFVPNPDYRSIQQMPEVFCVYKRSIDYVKRQSEKGYYNLKDIKELGWSSAGGASPNPNDSDEAWIKSLDIEGAIRQEDIESDTLRTPEIDILEAYCKLIWDEEPYEVGSGYKIRGKEEESIVHIGNYKVILSKQKNIYGTRPLFDVGCYMHPEMFWDIGMVRLVKGIQYQYDNLANLRMQNAMMLVNQMLKVREDSDIPEDSLIWKPFGIIPVEEMSDVEPMQIPDFGSQIFLEQEAFYKDTIQDLTGMYDYNMGQTPQRQEKVGVVYSIQQMGESRAKLMLMSMDYLGLRPLLKYMMVLNTYHLPNGFEYRIGDYPNTGFSQIFAGDLHPDYDFQARYTSMEPALGKAARVQQLVQLASMWGQSPFINQYQMMRTVFELMDVRETDTIIKDPRQLEQEMKQQVQQQMMMEEAKQREMVKGQMAISHNDFMEEKALNQDQFQYDMALEALKLEAANERSAKASR